MKLITQIGKYLDQPLLTAKISKNIPMGLAITSGAFLVNTVNNTKGEENKKKTGLKTAIILGATSVAAVSAPYVASKLTKRNMPLSISNVLSKNKELADEFLKQNPTSDLKNIVEKTKTKLLNLKEIKELFTKNKKFADKLIPPPDNIQAKDIFKEIGYLSVYGAMPVVGGVTGGIIADKIYENNWKDRVPNKIKEGIYQYLANIFLCNIGAGTALAILEKMNIKSKAARCLGMVTGIITTGVIAGSSIANFIGNKIVNPLLLKEKHPKKEHRTPELLDLTLHTDDIATVSLLSGLKWIEPSLPMLYSISGYKAGIGYRN